jgi:hypothetical protein
MKNNTRRKGDETDTLSLNMCSRNELDGVRSPSGLCAQIYSLAETPQPPSPAFGLEYEGAIGQPR